VRVPNFDAAIIPAEKIRDYLLSESHPIGRYKAAFFCRLGFEQSQWQQLESALRGLLQSDVTGSDVTEHGHKYLTVGTIVGPAGQSAKVVAIWIILASEQVPRFVTAYPEE
jgi:hypothetical protein